MDIANPLDFSKGMSPSLAIVNTNLLREEINYMKTSGVVRSIILQIDMYAFLCLYFYWTAIWVNDGIIPEDFIQIVNNLFNPAGSHNQK